MFLFVFQPQNRWDTQVNIDVNSTLWWTNIAIENGPVEIVDFPINSMVIFHCFLYVHQRVDVNSISSRLKISATPWPFAGQTRGSSAAQKNHASASYGLPETRQKRVPWVSNRRPRKNLRSCWQMMSTPIVSRMRTSDFISSLLSFFQPIDLWTS